MLLRHFAKIAEQTVTGVLFAIGCTMAAIHFGEPEIFDPIALFVFVTIAILFRHDRNLLSLMAFIVIAKTIEEIAWLIFDNTLLVKIPLYTCLLLVIPFISRGFLKLYLFAFVGFAVGAEVYWLLTDYPAPGIYWQVWMCVLAAMARRAVAMRVFWMLSLTKHKAYDFMKLDDHMFNVFTLLMVAYSAITAEYYLRHFFNLPHITYIYYSTDYIGSFLSSFVIYMLIVESFKHIKRSELGA